MADPSTPSTTLPDATVLADTATAADAASKSMDALNASVINSNVNLNEMTGLAVNAGSAFNQLNTYMNSLNLSLNNTGAFTTKQTTQFSLLTNMVLGAKEAYTNFANVDSGNLNTFSSQVDGLLDILNKKGTAPNLVAGALGSLRDMFVKSGGSANEFNKAAAQGTDVLSGFLRNTLTAADNALRLQNAYIQLAARTGSLNSVFEAAGPNLNNINDLLLKQSIMMTDVAAATGVEISQVQKYYSELGSVPGALQSVVTSGGSAEKTVSMLTATIKLATGTGRAYSDVVDDLKVAFRDYNLVGEPALQFTARMSEISNKFGINLDVVRESLRGTAGAFKMFGNEGEASAKILNSYVGALKSTGLSGDAAIDVVSNMTNSIKDLSIARKSFLSSQTGGAGGLMGGFQIEKMLREGKMDEVFEKIRKQMQRQFGKIVNLDEASKSQGAASQFERQILLLKQGPLGSLAKDDQSAMRILEGFRAKSEGKIGTTDLSNKIVQDSMNKGTIIEEKSYTELVKIRSAIDRSRGIAETGTLGFMQQAFAIGSGQRIDDGGLSAAQVASKSNLRNFMTESGTSNSGQVGINKNLAGTQAANAIKQFESIATNLSTTLKAPLDAISNMFEGNKKIDGDVEFAKFKKSIEQEKILAGNKTGEERKSAFDKIKQEQDLYNSSYNTYSTNTSGSLLGQATNRSINKPKKESPHLENSIIKNNVSPPENKEIVVHVMVTDDRVTYKVGKNAAANNVASRQ